MVDEKISDFPDGGLIEATDFVAGVRAGANTKFEVGTMASQDTADYLDEPDTLAAINQNPTIINVTGNLTLDYATHNGCELWLQPHTGSPSIYTVTIPYGLTNGFRCSFVNMCLPGEVNIKAATGSPTETLNGVAAGNATFQAQYAGAYLRKPATGQYVIIGGIAAVV